MRWRFCDCCDSSVYDLANMSLEERLNGTDNEGMRDVLRATSLSDLGDKGKQLVDWCIDFLIFARKDIDFPKKNPENHSFHRNKYICIWSFIYNFLGIPQDSGYDYWLLSFLEWNGLMEHGSGIRCGWLAYPEDIDRKLTEDRENEIIKWGNNCPDELS